jgi:hypothetical protein
MATRLGKRGRRDGWRYGRTSIMDETRSGNTANGTTAKEKEVKTWEKQEDEKRKRKTRQIVKACFVPARIQRLHGRWSSPCYNVCSPFLRRRTMQLFLGSSIKRRTRPTEKRKSSEQASATSGTRPVFEYGDPGFYSCFLRPFDARRLTTRPSRIVLL